MARVVCAVQHPVDLADGRSLAPGEALNDVDIVDNEHNKQLVADGQIIVLDASESFAGKNPNDTGGDA